MGNAPATWLSRHLGGGWPVWGPRLGVAAWFVGLYAIVRAMNGSWSLGEVVLALFAWVLVLAACARSAVRDMFGPVFFYDVVRVARRRSTFTLRFLYIAVVAAVMIVYYIDWLESEGYFNGKATTTVAPQRLANFADLFFYLFTTMQYIFIVVMTPVYVAGAIAVEKERKTLEFLLATDLKNREIVFGKLAARVMNLLTFVLAGLPILAILQLFGGIDPDRLLAAFAATVITVVGVSAVSLWFSAMSRRARDAIALTYLALGVYFVGSLILMLCSFIPGPWVVSYPQWGVEFAVPKFVAESMFASGVGNPIMVAIRLVGDPAMRANPVDMLREFATFWGLVTFVALSWAILRLRVVALAQSYGPARKRKEKRTAEGKPARFYPEVGDNPVFWKEVFVDSGFRGGWMFRLLAMLIALMILVPVPFIVYMVYVRSNRAYGVNLTNANLWEMFTEGMSGWIRVVTGILCVLMSFACAMRGAGTVSGEKDRDTWISLVGTPMTSDAILWGKWWGCVLGMRRVYFFIALLWSICLAVGAIHPLALIPAVASLLLFASVFSWVGIFCSIRAKNSLNASIQAFFLTLFGLGGFWALLGLCCAMPMHAMGLRGREIEDFTQVALGCTPPMTCAWFTFRSWKHNDLQPFSFEFENTGHPIRGFGFYSLVVGFVFWLAVNVCLQQLCLSMFRTLTNRELKFLPPKPPMPLEVRSPPKDNPAT